MKTNKYFFVRRTKRGHLGHEECVTSDLICFKSKEEALLNASDPVTRLNAETEVVMLDGKSINILAGFDAVTKLPEFA